MAAPKNKSALPSKPDVPVPAVLRHVTDMELGATLLTGADDAARRMASEICPPGITPRDREALGEFLRRVSYYVRWPGYQGGW
jgi:hypothetical protein